MNTRLKIAQQEEQSGNLSDAAAIYGKAVQDEPDNTALVLADVQLLLRTGDVIQARNAVLLGLQSQPGNRELLRESGVIELQDGNGDLALATFDQLLQSDRSDWKTMMDKGVALDIGEDHAAAQRLYCAAAAIHPASPMLATDYAMSLMLQGNFTGARQILGPYFMQYSLPAETRADLAVLYDATGDSSRTRELVDTDAGAQAAQVASALPRQTHQPLPCVPVAG
jgi:Flp pilus assembly protein TadD